MADDAKKCPGHLVVIPLIPIGRATPPKSATPTSGPSQVATAAYRDGWDTLFGGKVPRGQA